MQKVAATSRRRRQCPMGCRLYLGTLVLVSWLFLLRGEFDPSSSSSFVRAERSSGSIRRDFRFHQKLSGEYYGSLWGKRGGQLTKNADGPPKLEPVTPPPPPPPTTEMTTAPLEEVIEEEPQDDPKILMLIRLLFITYYGSLGSLLPYLPVYYHSLGHGGQVIGMLGAIKPFTTFLVAPFWGIVSDQSGSPFTVLYFTFIISLVAQLLVAWKHNPTYIMVMVFVSAFFNAPVKSLLDSMVISHLNDRSCYGRLRLWGQLGFGLGSSGVGILLSKSKHRPYHHNAGHSILEKLENFWQSLTGYKLLFLTYACLSVPTWICIRAFHKLHDEKEREKAVKSAARGGNVSEAKEKETSSGVWNGISVLFHDSDAVLFFFLVFVVGVSSGIIENFAYVRIREVGGTGKDMGLSRLVSSIAGAPMFWFSGPLTEMLGADRVIVLSLISYVARFIIYAMMRNPLQGLPAEALRGVTFAAFWSTATIYASRIAPPGLGATMVRSTIRDDFSLQYFRILKFSLSFS
jgi:MFS-type transporter involved in bile tolerance (Atg22 family)